MDFEGCASCLTCQQFKVMPTKISTEICACLFFFHLVHLWKAQAGTLWPPGKLMALQKGNCALLSCHCCARYPNTALFAHVRPEKHEVPNTVVACRAYGAWCQPALSQVEEMKATNQCTNQDYYIQTVIRKKLPMKQRIAVTGSHLEPD